MFVCCAIVLTQDPAHEHCNRRGVIKGHLKPAIQEINRAMLDTIAACGDVKCVG